MRSVTSYLVNGITLCLMVQSILCASGLVNNRIEMTPERLESFYSQGDAFADLAHKADAEGAQVTAADDAPAADASAEQAAPDATASTEEQPAEAPAAPEAATEAAPEAAAEAARLQQKNSLLRQQHQKLQQLLGSAGSSNCGSSRARSCTICSATGSK